MIWVLFVWIGYAGEHSTVTQQEFISEQSCQAATVKIKTSFDKNDRVKVKAACLAKEKNK